MIQLAEQHAACRRVATLIAKSAIPADVFGVVADELAHLVGPDATFVLKVDRAEPAAAGGPPTGTCTIVAAHCPSADMVSSGRCRRLSPGSAAAGALVTGRPTRVSGEPLHTGPLAAYVDELGLQVAVATPITVAGCCWGVIVAASAHTDLPSDTEARMADFMKLAATAIANAQVDEQRRALAETQAALRRLAILVARGEPSEAVFAAVTREVLRHFGSCTARMIRFEPDGTETLIADEGTTGPHVRVGKHWEGHPAGGLTATVRRTGHAARIDDYRAIPGGEPYLREGLRSAVAVPIVVNGVLWGLIAVGSGEGPMPAGSEQRIADFTDLVAAAIANAQSRAELVSSRARIVAASDETRRQIERDLHDGAQQRLVTLGLRLRSAAASVPAEHAGVRTVINDVADALVSVIDELRETSRGIHPAILSEAGLPAAVRSLARRSAIPITLDLRIAGRLPQPVEVAAYYVVSEAVTNAAKHARASAVEVHAEAAAGGLHLSVVDDGLGGADPTTGSGLLGLKDRVEAVGGTLTVDSPNGCGTSVRCTLPVAPDPRL